MKKLFYRLLSVCKFTAAQISRFSTILQVELTVRLKLSGGDLTTTTSRKNAIFKNGTGSSLADVRNKRVVLGKYENAGRYLLLVMSQ